MKPKSYEFGRALVDDGLMSEEALERGILEGRFAPNPRERDYGIDQQVWLKILKPALDAANEQAKAHTFNVQARRIVGSENGEEPSQRGGPGPPLKGGP